MKELQREISEIIDGVNISVFLVKVYFFQKWGLI